MKPSILFITLIVSFTAFSQVPSAEWQIRTAVLPLEEDLRAGATVLGYNPDGELITLREGTNDMICLADDPTKDRFSVAAYHNSLEPFMKRGRDLKAQGLGFKEVFDTREKEVKAGTLEMPDKATLYVLSGELDQNDEPIDTRLRFVVYIPFATPESTGLPKTPVVPGAPWIMDPGTHRAHIMITPNYDPNEE